MNKLTSFYTSTDNHPIVKALVKKGYHDFEIAYCNMSLPDYGWTVIKCASSEQNEKLYGKFLGYTIKDSLNIISKRL
jgi:hypothetical protein